MLHPTMTLRGPMRVAQLAVYRPAAGAGPWSRVSSWDATGQTGGEREPERWPGAAFRRPVHGFRCFLILLHEATRTVQLALIHPRSIPAATAELPPALPAEIGAEGVDALLAMRLP